MIVWWGSEPLMIVGQAAIGGKTEIRAAIVDFSATAAAAETTADLETTAVAETTGKNENMIEAARAGQVRPGLGVMDGMETEKLELPAMTEEAKKTVMKPKTVLALQSQRLQTLAPSLFYPLETTLRSASLGKG